MFWGGGTASEPEPETQREDDNCIAVVTAASEKSELEASVEKQVRAYAKTINQSNADNNAARALALHGVYSRGTLKVNSSHPLTATLMNSELGLLRVISGCSAAIRHMQQTGKTVSFVAGDCRWTSEEYTTYFHIYDDDSWEDSEKRVYASGLMNLQASEANSYDNNLEWIGGAVRVRVLIERKSVGKDTATYDVKVTFIDRFDFRGDNGSVSADLASLLGSALFREFDWEAVAKFRLTVPNSCTHKSANYHWKFNGSWEPITVESDDTRKNPATFASEASNTSGNFEQIYQMETPVLLVHDRPWDIEITCTGNGYVYLGSHKSRGSGVYLRRASNTVFFGEYAYVNEDDTLRTATHYGVWYTQVPDKPVNVTEEHTYRLTNHVNEDGSNMVYLYIDDVSFGPMNAYYHSGKSMSQTVDWVNGKDFTFRYISLRTSRKTEVISADSIKVWENGKNQPAFGYYEQKTIAPTCADKGYDKHTCSACGYSYKDNYVPATGHSYSSVTTPPTCTESGFTTHTCATCGDVKTDASLEALGHDFGEWEVTKDFSCTEGGERKRVCARCEYVETEEIASGGHSYEPVVTPPTCTEAGYTTYTCCVCGDTCQDAYVDATGHSYEALVTAPTCTTEGYTTHTCACGDTYTDTYVEPLGHDYQPRVIDPTYTKSGYTEYTCSRCADSYVDEASYTDPLGLPTPVVNTESNTQTGKPVLSWEADGEADYYEVFRAASAEAEYGSIGTVTEAAYTDEAAKAGKTYYYKVKAVCEANETLSSDASECQSAKCCYPQAITEITHSSGGYPILRWGKVDGAKKYDVYYSANETGEYKKLTSTSSTSYTHSKAASGKTYYYKVRAYGSSSTYAGAWSEIVSGVKQLAKPTLTVTTNNDAATAKLTWKKITGAKSYELQLSISGNDYETVDILTGTSYTLQDMQVGDSYTFRLRALCDNEEAWSDYSVEKTAFVKCGKPVLTASTNEQGKPVLSWETIEGAAKYELQMATSSKGKFKTLATVEETQYTHEEAVGGKTYYYKVKAIDANGNSGSLSSCKSATCDCAVPVITDVTTNSSGYPMIKWGKAAGAKKYEVWYATEEDGSYKKLTTTSSTSYTYSKAKMNQEYYFKVRAYGASAASLSDYTEPVLALRKLAKPSITLTTSQSKKTITLKWKKITKAVAYELQVSVNGGEFETVYEGSKLTYTDTELAPGNRYTYRLRAIAEDDTVSSDYSPEKSATIKAGKPNLSISLDENGKPRLTWDEVEGAAEYQIYYATSKNGKYKLAETTEELTYIRDTATKNKIYYFKVRAIDINGTTGDFSSVKSIKSK